VLAEAQTDEIGNPVPSSPRLSLQISVEVDMRSRPRTSAMLAAFVLALLAAFGLAAVSAEEQLGGELFQDARPTAGALLEALEVVLLVGAVDAVILDAEADEQAVGAEHVPE
jgi:hypothetical protein